MTVMTIQSDLICVSCKNVAFPRKTATAPLLPNGRHRRFICHFDQTDDNRLYRTVQDRLFDIAVSHVRHIVRCMQMNGDILKGGENQLARTELTICDQRLPAVRWTGNGLGSKIL